MGEESNPGRFLYVAGKLLGGLLSPSHPSREFPPNFKNFKGFCPFTTLNLLFVKLRFQIWGSNYGDADWR